MAVRTVTDTKASTSITSAGTDATGSWVSGTGVGSWVGFHVFISADAGSGYGQIRYGETSAGADLLYVSEPWAYDPITGNVYQAYNQDDLNSSWGNDFKLLLKGVFEWDIAATTPGIDGGGIPAFAAFVNNAFSSDDSWYVSAGGAMAFGKRVGTLSENPTDGLYYKLNNTNTTSGYTCLSVASGGYLDFADVKSFSVYPHRWVFEEGAQVTLNGVVSFSQTYGSQINGDIYGSELLIIGNGFPGEYIHISSGLNSFAGPIKLSNTYGFYPPSGHSSPSGQSIYINKYVSIGALNDVRPGNNTIYFFVDPQWSDPIIDWTQQNNGASTVWEYFTNEVTVADTDGIAVSGALLQPVEGSGTVSGLSLYTGIVTDASGYASGYINPRSWSTSSTSAQNGPFDIKVYHYDYQTFNSPDNTFTGPKEFPITFLADNNVVASASVASGYNVDIEFDSSSGNQVFDVSGGVVDITGISGQSIVNGATSTASGYVIDYIGTSADGKMVITGASGTWGQNDEIWVIGEASVCGYADVGGFYENYTYMIRGNGASIQNIYDYCKVFMSSAAGTPAAWTSGGRRTHNQLVYKPGTNFTTERETSAGVFITNFGAGNFDYMESDDGTQYTPPASVTLEINGVETTDEPTNYVRCHIECLSGGPETEGTVLLNDYANTADGTGKYKATAAYQYAGDQPVVIRARYAGYLPFTTNGTIDSGGITITAIWQVDPNYTP